MSKANPALILEDELDKTAEDETLVAEKIVKKELNPIQKAVATRRRIENYLEGKSFRETYGFDVPQEL